MSVLSIEQRLMDVPADFICFKRPYFGNIGTSDEDQSAWWYADFQHMLPLLPRSTEKYHLIIQTCYTKCACRDQSSVTIHGKYANTAQERVMMHSFDGEATSPLPAGDARANSPAIYAHGWHLGSKQELTENAMPGSRGPQRFGLPRIYNFAYPGRNDDSPGRQVIDSLKCRCFYPLT